jgi:hypothetical protein
LSWRCATYLPTDPRLSRHELDRQAREEVTPLISTDYLAQYVSSRRGFWPTAGLNATPPLSHAVSRTQAPVTGAHSNCSSLGNAPRFRRSQRSSRHGKGAELRGLGGRVELADLQHLERIRQSWRPEAGERSAFYRIRRCQNLRLAMVEELEAEEAAAEAAEVVQARQVSYIVT